MSSILPIQHHWFHKTFSLLFFVVNVFKWLVFFYTLAKQQKTPRFSNVFRRGEGYRKKPAPWNELNQNIFFNPWKKTQGISSIMTFHTLFGSRYLRMDQVKICGRQPLKNLNWYVLPKQTIALQIIKVVFHKFYPVVQEFSLKVH